MELASLIVSIIALAASGFTYFIHDRKIKKQEATINDYQLTKLHEEKIVNKKAQLSGSITIFKNDGKRILKITNHGKATATNVRMKVLNGVHITAFIDPFPFELLNPTESFEMTFYIPMGPCGKLKVKYIWDDPYQNNNEFTQLLQLY